MGRVKMNLHQDEPTFCKRTPTSGAATGLTMGRVRLNLHSMYLHNEKAFEHDVRRFMMCNGQPIRRLPFWQNVQIGLFQLFLAVYERGGFEKVTGCEGGWLKVYRELSGVTAASSGSAAKGYYKKNLFPYELYLKGMDYNASFKDRKKKLLQELDPGEGLHDPSNQKPTAEGEDTEELVRLLKNMEDQEQHLTWDPVPTQQVQDLATPSLEVTFYDESPPIHIAEFKEADLASDFKESNFPDESAHIVPYGDFYDSVNADRNSDEVLHQMEVLQQELCSLHEDLLNF